MERIKGCKGVCLLLLLYLAIAATPFTHCDAGRSAHRLLRSPTHPRSSSITKHTKKLKGTKHFDLVSLIIEKETMDATNTEPYASSPFNLLPYDSLAPYNLPEYGPPYCIYPPNAPQAPSTTIPTPTGYTPSPPPSPFYYLPPVLPIPSPPPSPAGTVPSPPGFISSPNPPEIVSSPPIVVIPSPPQAAPSPPETMGSPIICAPSPPEPLLSPPYYEPSPPVSIPSPPTSIPSPTGFSPIPPVFLPPVVYPPPTVPPSPRANPVQALWCVAKPSVPDPIIQEAMSYACGSGADCNSIQPSGSCFEPNTVFAHASYAFNSYWQRTKVAGGSCSFGGTAMLVTVDPSYDDCHFVYF